MYMKEIQIHSFILWFLKGAGLTSQSQTRIYIFFYEFVAKLATSFAHFQRAEIAEPERSPYLATELPSPHFPPERPWRQSNPLWLFLDGAEKEREIKIFG